MLTKKPALLIVDDDELLLQSFQRQLSADYDCLTWNCAEAVIEYLRSSPEPAAAVICDMYMPGMDGMELISRLSRLSPETVCILHTGGGDPELPVRALNEGRVFHFLQKPCPPAQIKRIVDLAVKEHQRRMAQKSFTWRMTFTDNQLSELIMGPGCFPVTAYRASEFTSDPGLLLSIGVSEDNRTIHDFLKSIQQQQPVQCTEFRIRRKDMRTRWLRMAVLAQGDPDASLRWVEGFLEDITEQREVELAIEEASHRYQTMVANIPGIVFHCLLELDGTLRFTFVSSSCRQLLDVDPEQIYQDSELLLKSFTPDDLARFYRSIAESAATLEPFTWQGGHLKNDRRLWFQTIARPERLENGQVLWDGVMMDITALKEAERNAQFLAMFPSENPNPVLRIRHDGTILYANPASAGLLAIWHRTVGQQVPEDIFEIVSRVVQFKQVNSAELLCKDRYFSAVFAPVTDSEAVNLYARDITGAKNAELELIVANQKLVEHDKLKNEFVSTITHELRTPLCIFKNIISNALAGVTGPVSPKLRESLEMAQQSVERLKRIIADFTEITEIDAGTTRLNRKITFMQNLIKETVDSMKPLAGAKRISLLMNVPPKPVYADVDPLRIVKVLENIIGNAIKFIPVRGSIYVTLTDYLHGDFFDVCVRDNGPGMSRKEAAKVFDRFVQAKILKGPGDHGTGLGLTIAKEIINIHGGHIWVETEPKHGCAFFFRLPKNEGVTFENPGSAATPAEKA